MPLQTKKLFLFFLPLNNNEGNLFPEIEFANVVVDIRQRFGGLTWMRPTCEYERAYTVVFIIYPRDY